MPDDPLLTASQAAARAVPPLSVADFRSRVARGLAPPPDDPDEDRSPQRRRPRWLTSTIDAWTRRAYVRQEES
jgi:hypothetical protein